MVKKFGQMGRHFKDFIFRAESMEKATLNGLMAPNTMEIFKTTNSMAQGPTSMPMDVGIKDSGTMEKSMAKEFSFGLMDEGIEVNIKTI